MQDTDHRTRPRGKFEDPRTTAAGEERARVRLEALETLWFNTGTLCNITCVNCYIESSPTNDRLDYLSAPDVAAFLDEIAHGEIPTREIGFTGGEPFMNPAFPDMLEDAARRGFDVLVLTNAMQPMQRPRVQQRLLQLRQNYNVRLRFRVSLDHFTAERHEMERGPETYARAVAGLDWLNDNGFQIAIAGRTLWGEAEDDERRGYASLIARHGWRIDPDDPKQLVLLPEMDDVTDVPEITTACWSILSKRPDQMMCASSRMIIKRKGAPRPVVVPCTLLPYHPEFEMGSTLAEAAGRDSGMFADGDVLLCHRNCAKFCVLGGGSCS
ncbi:MAG: radical SAM protein [Hyphomicrobiaceae bacterium]